MMWTRLMAGRIAALLLVAPLAAACRDRPTLMEPVPSTTALSIVSPAVPSYTEVFISTGVIATAYGINASGHVTGRSTSGTGPVHAFLWTPADGMQNLGAFPGARVTTGRDINDSGTVVGESSNDVTTWAFSRSSAGEWRHVGPPGANSSRATAINARGEIVGPAFVGGAFRGFLYRPGAETVYLPSPVGWPTDINDSSEVVGYITSSPYSSAFIMKSSGTVQIIAPSPSFAHGINNAGQVVGGSGIYPQRAFVWDSAGGIRYLPGHPPGGMSIAFDIDDVGRISGEFYTGDRNFAVLWTPDGTGGYNLIVLGPGRAEAHNAQGVVVGYRSTMATRWVPGPPMQPAAPTNLVTRVISTRRVDLSWTDASNNEFFFAVQRAARQADGTFGPYQPIGRVQVNGTVYVDLTPEPGDTYRYRLDACNDVGCAGSTAVEVVVPLPNPPTGVTARAVSATRVNVGWTDPSSHVASFRIRRSARLPDGTFPPFRIIGRVGAGESAYADSTAAAGHTYRYLVEACYAAECASSGSVLVNVPQLPAAPAGLSATVASGQRIHLAWTDASTNESSFRVRRSTRAPNGAYPPTQTIGTLGAGEQHYVDSTVLPGNSYRYLVQACNASGCTGSADVVTVEPAPAAPVGVGARAVSGTRVDVRWTDASNDETAFRVQRSTRRPDGTFAAFQTVGTVGAGVTVFSDDTVAGGSTYRYRVQACRNATCASSASTPVTVPAS